MTPSAHRRSGFIALLAVAIMAATPHARAGTLTTIHAFIYAEGGHSEAPVIDVGGDLWGTNAFYGTGPSYRDGTVFKIPAAGGAATIIPFAGSDGEAGGNDFPLLPLGGLVQFGTNLYGTTAAGGAYGNGAIFAILPSGKKERIYTFQQGDASGPSASMIVIRGKLYGTAQGGGADGEGAVFSIRPNGKEETVLYSFSAAKSSASGYRPTGPLLYAHGLLYGTATYGGAHARGVIFSLTLQGKEKILHAFTTDDDGQYPVGGLVELHGMFYGATKSGGSKTRDGTVFSMTPGGTERVLYRFRNGKDGASPQAGLTRLRNTLYGTTTAGGAYNAGTIFSVTPDGVETVAYAFQGADDGQAPFAPLLAVGATLYGTTPIGGTYQYGTLFSFTP